ncbi:jasmonate-induced oxygenase 2-like isoform X1 [Tasmannia lanceolata]|uniref:jasmonate-induced oxygenase 2-like isoform X1 n=1 Tax=Tasmannia lanceolata TaxID=3420 RepID=UPI004064525F
MDSLQEWPEPIIRVQSLSDSGITAIPNRYVKPLIDRPTVGLLSGFNIPIIDLGGLDGNETVRQMSGACREWGFFQVINHGVSPELIRKTREVWKEFFHLPIEQRQVYANSPKTYEGYGSRLGVEKGAILDWGDYYFLHLLPLSLKSHHKWPAIPASCRDVIEEYGQQLVKLGGNIMKMLSKGLGLEEGYLQNAFGGEDIGACLRVNFYPKCPQPDLTLGLSSHSDPGGLTILLPDDYVDGLQVRKDDAWVTVQPSPDAFIVNIGDQIQVLSNMEYKSIEHRVIVNSIQERLSLACFYNPKSDIPIGPIPELVTPDQPTLYRPMTFNEYRLFIRHQGPRGKSQVESLASRRAASVIQHS